MWAAAAISRNFPSFHNCWPSYKMLVPVGVYNWQHPTWADFSTPASFAAILKQLYPAQTPSSLYVNTTQLHHLLPKGPKP